MLFSLERNDSVVNHTDEDRLQGAAFSLLLCLGATPLLRTFTGPSPAHLAGFELWDPFAQRVQEDVCLETMDLSHGTQEALQSVVVMGLPSQVVSPWSHVY